MTRTAHTPKVSVIIVGYNMARELPRTVESFLPPYQTGLSHGDVEIIVIDNGSPKPVPTTVREMWPDSVRYYIPDDPRPSPVFALNDGARMARADILCTVIDGARMASPGLLSRSLEALSIWPDRFIIMPSLHLGPDIQSRSSKKGYEQRSEDRLLDQIHWPYTPYRLFNISAPAGSAQALWYGAMAECNSPLIRRSDFDAIGGFDEGFDIPGGGLANLDFFNRAVAHFNRKAIMILGEATFHQYHGGMTTSKGVQDEVEPGGPTAWDVYTENYLAVVGKPFEPARYETSMFGRVPREAYRLSARVLSA